MLNLKADFFDSVDMALATLPNANDLIGAVSGAYFAGGMIGAIIASEATDHLGRRLSIFVCCILAFIGGGLQAGSVNMAMFISARLIAGLGTGELIFGTRSNSKADCMRLGGLLAAIPVYTSEISPPKTRGLVVGLHGVFIAFGTVLCK
jgi:MFS family permease